MQISILIPTIGLALLPLYSLYSLLSFFKLKKRLGQRVFEFTKKRPFHFFGILLCMPILIGLLFFRSFDILTTIAITGTGFLGYAIALKDIISSRISGLYSDALVWHGEYLSFSQIDSLSLIDPYSIELILEPRDKKILAFEDKQKTHQLYESLVKALKTS